MNKKTRDSILFRQMCIHLTCFFASKHEISIFNPQICNFWSLIHSFFYCNDYTNIDKKKCKKYRFVSTKVKG